MAVVVKNVLGGIFGDIILGPMLVVGLNRMFTGGTIWVLTHGHMAWCTDCRKATFSSWKGRIIFVALPCLVGGV